MKSVGRITTIDLGFWARAALLSFACFQNMTMGGLIYGIYLRNLRIFNLI